MKNNTLRNFCLAMILLPVVLLAVSCASRAVPAATGKSSLKIMSYNTHHCNPPDQPAVIDVDAIATLIKKEQPDIVALQEIDVNTVRSGRINQAAEIALKAGYQSFYFAKAIDFDAGQYGVAILSKYPLTNMVTHRLPTDETIGGEHRVLATAAIKLPNGQQITFACTHLDAQKSHANRLLQIKEIKNIAGKVQEPFIIAGDFNAIEGSEVINMLDQDFTRTCEKCVPTIEEEGEKIAIDFIAFKPAGYFTVESHKVGQGVHASDHYPVTAVLKF